MGRMNFLEAIRSGLHEEMARDPSVYLLGEDVTMGGPFGATKGLADAFGERRVLNTPISESTIMGMATGAAALGFRPVVEVMFIDFITLAMDQLVNHAAKLHYMTGGQITVPLTVRAQGGVAGASGAHHSQSLEAWFMHVPGLKIAMPSTPADAKGLLKAAIRDGGPVLFIEHRDLYWAKGDVPDGDHVVPLGVAEVKRHGSDVTILALSRMVGEALAAAEQLSERGVSVEVVDPRTLCPLDLDTIVASVRKTGRLVIAHEAVETGGAGAEIAARVQEAAFDYLDAPILRVGAPFVPVPASPVLEKAYRPARESVIDAVSRMLERI